MAEHAMMWSDMTASERLAASVDYLDFNYGPRHPYTVAARHGDLAEFRKITAHVTELMDVKIVSIVDARDDAGPVYRIDKYSAGTVTDTYRVRSRPRDLLVYLRRLGFTTTCRLEGSNTFLWASVES